MNKRTFLIALGAIFPFSAHAATTMQNTWHDYRFRNMVEQGLDMSCGAASLAALLTYYGKQTINEAQLLSVLASLVEKQEEENVIRDGFSLLHLKRAAGKLGFELKAAHTQIEQMVRFESPAMLQLKTRMGYHFVLWHGRVDGLNWLGDPTRGDLWLDDAELQEQWTGIAAWLFKGGEKLSPATERMLSLAREMR